MTSPATGKSARCSVLVVGAGPVGLVLACELLRRGVAVRVIDAARAPGSAPQSRAVLIWPRTLELLHGIAAVEPLAAVGHRLDAIAYRSAGRLLGQVRMSGLPDTPYPYALTLPQYETEQVLLQRLRAYGGDVERGIALEGVTMTVGGRDAVAVLRHPDGTQAHAITGLLVGADGAHSTVRKELGIAFEGDTADVTFGIADAPVLGPVARDTLHYCYTPGGAMGVVPLPSGLFRVAVSIPHCDPAYPPPAAVFEQALHRHAPGFGDLGEPRWTGSFRVRCRIAGSFRRGRAFLVGDAAHVISPAGGQGMNLGIQDAVNLGWKLAGVAVGTLSEAILDSYQPERRAAAQRVAAATAAQTRWGMLQGRARIATRDTLVRVASASGALQRMVGPLMAQTDVRYGTPHSGRILPPLHPVRPRVGTRLPVFAELTYAPGQPPRAPGGPVLAADRFTVLSWAGTGGSTAPEAATALAGRATVTTVGAAAPPVIRRALGRAGALVTVRPDGHVAFVAANSAAGLAETAAFLDTQLAAASPART